MPTLPGGAELIVILVVVILLFGARKLPELGSSVGKSIKNFKAGIRDAKDEDEPTSEADVRQTVPPQTQSSRDLS